MKLVIKPFQYVPCKLKTFTINGKKADCMDFGDTYDHDKRIMKPDGCGDMYFEPKPPIKGVLNKYNITEKEYYNICNKLKDELSVGSCGWCILVTFYNVNVNASEGISHNWGGYIEGAKWTINEFLKDLWHPISENQRKNVCFYIKLCSKDMECIK